MDKENKGLFNLWVSGFCSGVGIASIMLGFVLWGIIDIGLGLLNLLGWYILDKNN